MQPMSFFLCLLCILYNVQPVLSDYVPTESNLEARKWFQDAHYGLFVHWGAYSLVGHGEWVMELGKVPLEKYEAMAKKFNPQDFDPAQWVSLARDADMRYIVITTKHHDGFALFESQASRYTIVHHAAYKKDIIKMLADECAKQGMKLFFYYSQLDWHHPDYYPLGTTGHHAARPEHGDWKNYLAFMNQQLTELLTNYGPIAGIWFDGWWDKPEADWELSATYNLIHELQPHALIGSNHHQTPFDGEDFQMFEKDLPGLNESGFSKNNVVSDLPLETCETMNMNELWGFNKFDTTFKSVKTLIHYLVKAAGNGANFLLNVGPMADGKIQPEFIARLKEIGQWLSINGESIYNTRKGPVMPQKWGVSTRRNNTVYIHVLAWDGGQQLFVPFSDCIKSAYYFADKSSVGYEKQNEGILINNIPTSADAYDIIIVFELSDAPADDQPKTCRDDLCAAAVE